MVRLFKSLVLYFCYFVNTSYSLLRYTIFKAIGYDAKPIVADFSPKIAMQILATHSFESSKPLPLVNFFLSILPKEVEMDDSFFLKSKSSYTDKGIETEFRYFTDGPSITLRIFEDGLDSETEKDVFDIDKLVTEYDRVKFSDETLYTLYALNSPLFMFTALSGYSPQGVLEFYIHKENKNKGVVVDKYSGYADGVVTTLHIDTTQLAGCTQEDNLDNPLAPPWFAFFSDKKELFTTIEETGCGGFLNVNGQMIPLSQP